MALIIAMTTLVDDVAYDVNGGDELRIDRGIILQSLMDTAVFNYAGRCSVLNNGTISAAVDGIQMGITGWRDDIVSPSQTVTNNGLITAERNTVVLYGTDPVVANTGTITGSVGVFLKDVTIYVPEIGNSAGEQYLTNTGTIVGQDIGVLMSCSLEDGHHTIKNSGTIIGIGDAAIRMEGTFGTIINAGRIVGDVEMLGLFNRYDGRAGIVAGTVSGSTGQDEFVAGSGADMFDGGGVSDGDGDGEDEVIFATAAGVQYALDGSFAGSGVTVGDTYINIEGLWGSNIGSDRLRGDANDNTLRGRGGNDTLAGVQGNDTLNGGDGRDVMSGGAGDDDFIYSSLGHAGDRILDFEGGPSGGDSIGLVRQAVEGSGLVVGIVAARHFRARADNLAQDADDRFIFRTTDTTLWFDRNGNVSGGLTLIADLQAGAVVTTANIEIDYLYYV